MIGVERIKYHTVQKMGKNKRDSRKHRAIHALGANTEGEAEGYSLSDVLIWLRPEGGSFFLWVFIIGTILYKDSKTEKYRENDGKMKETGAGKVVTRCHARSQLIRFRSPSLEVKLSHVI